AAFAVHLPDRMMSIGMAARSTEQIPIQRTPHVGRDGVPKLGSLEGDWVVFVDRLAINDRLDRMPIEILSCIVVATCELCDVPILPHVEVEPVGIVKPLRRTGATRRVEC